jgi:exosortase
LTYDKEKKVIGTHPGHGLVHVMRTTLQQRLALAGLVCAYLLVYGRLLLELVPIWMHDENYSHGLIVLPVIAYLVWNRRERLAALEPRRSAVGLLIVITSLIVLLLGTAGVEFFLMRTSAIGVIVGAVLFVGGWQAFRIVAFPLALTAFLIPLPPVLFYQIAFPLQLQATTFGVAALDLAGIPVLREGNVIGLANTTLEVTEACSGIRSLLSLLALAALWAYFSDPRPAARVATVLSSIPIAIVANGLRIAGTGLAAHYIGPSAATGFFHSFSGWVVFVTSLMMLAAVSRIISAVGRSTPLVRPAPSFS